MAIWHKHLGVAPKTDYRCPPKDRLMVPWHQHPKAGAVIPASYDLSTYRPAIYNQGLIGECTACGTLGSIQTSLSAAGKPLAAPRAPLPLYRMTRALERAQGWTGGKLPPLGDHGANPDDAYIALNLYGCQSTYEECGEHGPSDKLTVYEEAHVNDEPSAEDLIVDLSFKATGQFRIMSMGQQRLNDVAAALSSRYAVGISVWALDDRFQGYTGGVMGPPPLGVGTDHWVYITRFRTGADGHFVFGCPNSWGAGWGVKGEFDACEAIILESDCIIVASVTEVGK